MVKSWMTSLAGILVILSALWECYEAGKLDLMCIRDVLIGAGFLAAKDRNVTGGTVASGTPESVVRVEEGKQALAPDAVERVESKEGKTL